MYYITVIEVLAGINLGLTVFVLRIHYHEVDDKMPPLIKCFVGSKQYAKEGKNPWHIAAKNLDKVLFTLSFILVVVFTTVFLCFCLL